MKHLIFILFLAFCVNTSLVCAQEGENDQAVEEPVDPIVLSIHPEQEFFKPKSRVTFSVRLTNTTRQSFRVKELTSGSLTCLFDGKGWGKPSDKMRAQIILRPGKSLTKKFRLRAPKKSGQMDLSCQYHMSFQGLQPEAEASILIKR